MTRRVLQENNDLILTEASDNLALNVPDFNRILQENGYSLLTEASEIIINDNFVTAVDTVTGTPVVQTTTINQGHTLLADNLVTGNPVLQTTAIAQDHNLILDSITTGSVVIQTTAINQSHQLSGNVVLTGNPVLQTTAIEQDHSLVLNSITTGVVNVAQAALTQDHDLDPISFVTGIPSVPVANMDEEETVEAPSFITGAPVLGSPELKLNDFTAYNITTGRPVLGKTYDPLNTTLKEIKEIEDMFGGWQRRAYEVPDGRLVQAEREIYRSFGEQVSVDKKAKSLIKFGKSRALPVDSLETVWTVGGHETYVPADTITHISSSSPSDNQEIMIECHTVEGTGADSKFSFLTQTVTLDGQNKVALSVPVARVSQIYNNNGTELQGRVAVYEDTAIVGGIPTDASKIHIDIPAGLQSSFKGATTFSDKDYYILTGGFGSVSIKQDAAADFYLEVREAGKVFRQVAAISASSGGPWNVELDPAVIIPKNADVRITAETSTNNAVVYGVFKGYLAKVI